MSKTKPKTETASATKPASETKTAVVIGVVSNKVPMPEVTSNRGSKSKYPFDELTEAGQSFPVIGKTAASLASVVSGQNRKAKVPVLDADGNPEFETATQTNSDGTTVEVPNLDKPKMKVTKKFFAVDVDPATDPDKATVRVFRKL